MPKSSYQKVEMAGLCPQMLKNALCAILIEFHSFYEKVSENVKSYLAIPFLYEDFRISPIQCQSHQFANPMSVWFDYLVDAVEEQTQ